MVNESKINGLIKQLSDKDGQVREKARLTLVDIGKEATLALTKLLTDKDTGEWTARGKTIVGHTPMGRLGESKDLFGGVLWLLSPASEFVTGIVVPIDGGFSAFSGV